MITKEIFCKALRLIREQESTDEKFSEALKLVGNGHYVFGVGNKYCEALLMVLGEAVEDRYGYISWWLYETTDYMVWSSDETMSWNLREPEDLYDYIINEGK